MMVTQRSGIYPSSIYYVFRNLLGTGRDKPGQSLLTAKLRVPGVFLSYFLEKQVAKVPLRGFSIWVTTQEI